MSSFKNAPSSTARRNNIVTLCDGVWDEIPRDGAKTLLEDAKAGVGAVGASWQGSREETGQQRFGRPVRPSQGFQQKETENEREFDVSCPLTSCASFSAAISSNVSYCKVFIGRSTAQLFGCHFHVRTGVWPVVVSPNQPYEKVSGLARHTNCVIQSVTVCSPFASSCTISFLAMLFLAKQVTFGEGRLGFTIFREDVGSRKGQGVVCKVHTGSTAHTLGVQVGDMVTCVNKHR